MSDRWRLSVTELSALLDRGEASAVSLLEESLARHDRFDPLLNTVVARSPGAHAAAEASDRRRKAGHRLGPLDGLSFTAKDNILTAGLPTQWGSRAFLHHVPEQDEAPVAKLKAAGAVLVGKTNVPEFTLEGFTDNALFGPTRNPWNPALTPGGSSGGAVAGVAAGLVPFAIGTDGGGSIRRPCAYTNLVGLKPSLGRVARVEALPALLLDMEVIGPVARDVAGAAAVFDAIAGQAPDDPRSWLQEEPGAALALDAAPGPLRILFVERLGDAPLDQGIAASVREVARRLARLGHNVTQGSLPLGIPALSAAWPKIGEAGLAALAGTLGERFATAGQKYRDMPNAARGCRLAIHDLVAILGLLVQLRREAARAFARWDVLLTPTCAAPPWPVGEDFPGHIDGIEAGPRGPAIYTGLEHRFSKIIAVAGTYEQVCSS